MAKRKTASKMKPSEEASRFNLALARAQGTAFAAALKHMATFVAHDGREVEKGEYLVAYAVEEAEGLYHPARGRLKWHEPTRENVHVEIVVRDAGDGRFIPGLKVFATLIDDQGHDIGTHQQPFLWHPWLYHYGRNWKVPGDGIYRLRIRFDAPPFHRHDKLNGRRFLKGAEIEFTDVKIKTGRK
ncbi:MAG: iron transporter [Sphingobacteriales bacterium]|jgi:hypothetical protein